VLVKAEENSSKKALNFAIDNVYKICRLKYLFCALETYQMRQVVKSSAREAASGGLAPRGIEAVCFGLAVLFAACVVFGVFS